MIGLSGAGKSTVFALTERFYDPTEAKYYFMVLMYETLICKSTGRGSALSNNTFRCCMGP